MTALSNSLQSPRLADDGLEVIDLRDSPEFAARRLHSHDVAAQLAAMENLGRIFLERPDTLLKELVTAAVDLCGADSAGISVEKDDRTEKDFYHWLATAGQYSEFLNVSLPRYPSACGICLERGAPQLLRVNQRFFEILGVTAPTVTDGLLFPWHADQVRGTIFVMAHGRTEAFDRNDCRMMQTLSNFVATAVRHMGRSERILARERNAAAVAMANHLAHKINNPLQGLVNVIYLAEIEGETSPIHTLARTLSPELQRLSDLVAGLLALPTATSRRKTSPIALHFQAPSDTR